MIYDKPEKENFQNKLEKYPLLQLVQYKEHQGKKFMMN